MSFITAERIHDGHKWLPAGTVVEVAEDGTIIALHSADAQIEAVFYEGILAPGFVNAHCHIELSHMKGVVPEGTGLIPFLQHVPMHRNDFTEEQKAGARKAAYAQLQQNGVVAVGDIANVTDTLDVRSLDELHIHTFIEAIGFTQSPQTQFEHSVQVYDAFALQGKGTKRLHQSIVPHAPYSVSYQLFNFINDHHRHALISIHNQESRAEDEYYLLKKGDVQSLLHGFGIDDSFFTPSGKSSLQTYLEWLSPEHPFIFVHNTYTTLADIEVAESLLPNVSWCFCPNANLYIEGRLPDIDLFVSKGVNICIGTDSLASNHELSVLSELNTIKKNQPHLPWEMLLRWGTYNGAVALQMHDVIGAIKPGMKPGIIQLLGTENEATAKSVQLLVKA